MVERNDKPGVRPVTKNICQVRQIKVTRSSYEYKPRKSDPYPKTHRTKHDIPWIQLKGLWLEQAGFSVDAPVKIRVMDGCLVLTVDKQ